MMLPSAVRVWAISGSGATWVSATDKAVVEIRNFFIGHPFNFTRITAARLGTDDRLWR